MREGKRVLVVEDDDAIRQLVRDLLIDAGYEAHEARTGNEGLAVALKVRPHLVLLDRRMPDGDGTEFAAGYAASPPPHGKIVALCAARDGTEWAAQIGAVEHISKPFDIEGLLATVARQLAGSGLGTRP